MTPSSPSLAAVEARNALRAEGFRRLPDDIETWRFREVLTQLGAALGLSGGAVVYALDLMGVLREADWRGEGRAVTFHSVRGYARKVGRCERTICAWERQLIAAGLVHRTMRHARRHGGGGEARRRTGLDWRSFGALLPALLDRLAARRAEEARRLDLEARIRAERRLVLALTEATPEHDAVRARLSEWGVLRLTGARALPELERRLAALVLLREDLAARLVPKASSPVENLAPGTQAADLSEETAGPKDTTDHFSRPKDDCKRAGETTTRAGRAVPRVPLARLWRTAPRAWKAMLEAEAQPCWQAVTEVATRRSADLAVSPSLWGRAVRTLGPEAAALALLILDRNRDHPRTPVRNVGGALSGMLDRAPRGELHLAASLHGMMARCEGVGGGAA